MATSELDKGSLLFFRQPDWNTYGILNVREEFAQRYPAYVEKVISVYERARKHALANPAELKATLVKHAKISEQVAQATLARTDLSHSVIGEAQRASILAAGDVLKKSGVVKPDTDVQAVAQALFAPDFAQRAVSTR